MCPTARDLYTLTKPGIIRGNALTAMGGFFLAAQGTFNGLLFAGMLVGLSLIVAAGCVLNNIIDRKIDAHMSRTSKRAIPNGRVSLRTAYMYALILSLVGVATLALLTNALALTISLFGLFMYVVIYGIAKRRSLYGTHIGSISGAVPPVVGYVSISGRLDVTALLLFLIVALWQMPHFFAIAIFRAKDYAAAAIPVLPLVKGVEAARRQILAYVLLFFLSVI
ncbi:protoheme IX farnesyltransferase, partial [Candidatus Saccharibacteria bacterium]